MEQRSNCALTKDAQNKLRKEECVRGMGQNSNLQQMHNHSPTRRSLQNGAKRNEHLVRKYVLHNEAK